jgi:hypothetical protein
MSNFITYAARLLMPLDTDTQEVLCPECEQVVCDCETIGSQDTWSTEEDPTTSDEEFVVDDDASLVYETECESDSDSEA